MKRLAAYVDSGLIAATMSADWHDLIESTPEVLRGKPRLKGTRIPVALVLGYLAAGHNVPSIQDELPDVTPDHVRACLAYARALADFELAA